MMTILKSTLKWMAHLFSWIVTAQVVFLAVFARNASSQTIIVTALLGIIPSFVLSLVLSRLDNISRIADFIVRLFHFLLTAILVFLSLNHFDVLTNNNLVPVIALFLTIYLATTVVAERQNKKTADELNKRINATHRD